MAQVHRRARRTAQVHLEGHRTVEAPQRDYQRPGARRRTVLLIESQTAQVLLMGFLRNGARRREVLPKEN